MKKFTFNFSFLERFKKSKPQEPDNEKIPSEYETDETPEEFAEKTLGNLKLNEHQEELKNTNFQKESDNDLSDSQIQYQEMSYPQSPKPVSKFQFKFKFKFPKFNESKDLLPSDLTPKEKNPTKLLGKISWNDFILRLFSPYSRDKVHAVFIIFLVAVIAYISGKSIALFFNKIPVVAKTARPAISPPLERIDNSVQDINKITSTNLFNIKETDKSTILIPKKDIESIICLDAEKPTSSEVKLLDTIVLQDSVKSVASVQIRGNSELINVREGERLDNMVEISKINRMRLVLKNLQTGDCEYVSNESENEPMMPNLKILSEKEGKALFKSTNPNIKNVGNNFKIKRTFRDSLVNNMSDVLTQAKAIQLTNPDGSLCFKMTEIIPGSIYSLLDIQENDIICSINGKKIENLNELMNLLGRIKEIDQFQVGLKRNGMSENKEYGFE